MTGLTPRLSLRRDGTSDRATSPQAAPPLRHPLGLEDQLPAWLVGWHDRPVCDQFLWRLGSRGWFVQAEAFMAAPQGRRSHQLTPPISFMVAGTNRMRTTVLSARSVLACGHRIEHVARLAGPTTGLVVEKAGRRPLIGRGRPAAGLRRAERIRTSAPGMGGWLMPEIRQRFHEELRALEDDVQRTGAQAQLLLDKALQALVSGDLDLCDEVVSGDDVVDALYLEVERQILHLFALQTPVASDLRLLTALLHINLHLERVGDQAVNLAKITTAANGLPQNPTVLRDLAEMGAAALGMVGAAMEALAGRDLALARRLPELDDPIDALNRGMLAKVLAVSDDQRMLEWGVRMYVVSRQLERIGDNAVDIAEQGGLSGHRAVPRVHRCLASGGRTPPSWLSSETSPKHNSVGDVHPALSGSCGMRCVECLPAPLGTKSLRTHNFAPDARRRPGKTPLRTALSPR